MPTPYFTIRFKYPKQTPFDQLSAGADLPPSIFVIFSKVSFFIAVEFCFVVNKISVPPAEKPCVKEVKMI